MRVLNVRITRARLLRVIADTVAVQVSLILAYAMRLALISTSESTFPVSHWVSEFAGSYLRSFLPLGLIFIALFALAGFYSGGKLYKTARLPWITAVVAAGFGLFAGMAFMAENWFNLPRGVVPLGKDAALRR